jgi:uncharacterized protein (TIGR02246 family)
MRSCSGSRSLLQIHSLWEIKKRVPRVMSNTSEVSDRQELRGLVDRYAQCADRRDRSGFAAGFTPDGILVVGGGREITGREAIGNVLEHLETTYLRTMHFVGNHVVDFVGDGAQGETYCIAHHIYSDNEGERDTSMFIRYNDVYVRTGDGWKMSRRQLDIAWQEDRPVTG